MSYDASSKTTTFNNNTSIANLASENASIATLSAENASISLLTSDNVTIIELLCGNVNMFYLSGLTTNVQNKLNETQTQVDTSTSKLTAMSYNLSTKTTSITADVGQTAAAQLVVNNGSNSLLFALNCTTGAYTL
jgi:hypothetical protein